MTQPQPTYEQLIAYAAGTLPADEAAVVASHLHTSAKARAIVDAYRSIQGIVQADDGVEPTESAIKRAHAAFRPRAGVQPKRWLEAVDRIIAHLVYDSRVSPAIVRTSEDSARIGLTFEADTYDIDVQAERDDRADDADAPPSWHVTGQVGMTGASNPDTSECFHVALVPAGSHNPIAETQSNESGWFQMHTSPGCYDLLILRSGRVLVLPAIDLP